MTVLQVAGDLVLGDQGAHQRLGFLGQVPQAATILGPHPTGDRHRVLALAGVELAAIAPGGAPGDAPGLEQDRVVTALGQVKSRGEAGQAATDDGDVATDLALQFGALDQALGRRHIVGIRMGTVGHACGPFSVFANQTERLLAGISTTWRSSKV